MRGPVGPLVLSIALGCASADPPDEVAAWEEPDEPETEWSPSTSGDFAQDLLGEHNRIRAAVGVGPLSWSPQLAVYAQEWAERLAADDCALEHRESTPYGENLAMWSGEEPVTVAAHMWEDERPDYDGGVMNDRNFAAGHYTQIVWRDSQRLGCGQAACADATVLVCNYDPPGNVYGEAPY